MSASRNSRGVVVLFNMTETILKGEPRDLIADQGVIACAGAVSEALRDAGRRVVHLPFSGDVELALEPFPPHDWTVFNLAEGMSGRLFEEARIAWALEAMGYSFTGSDGEAIARSLHKARAKTLLASAGVATPTWHLICHPDELKDIGEELSFPRIVKPVAEDASIGIDSNAVVHTPQALRERVAYVLACYRQSALVEEYIPGREFNISMIGNPPTVLPLAEIDFGAIEDKSQRIVSFAAKWEKETFEYNNTPVLCPATVDDQLQRDIQSIAMLAWEAIGCRSYARVDMRVDEVGRPYVIEVNCNPDISPEAGFFRAMMESGSTYQEMITRIVSTVENEDVKDRRGFLKRRTTRPAHHRAGRSFHADRSIVREGIVGKLSDPRRS